MFDFKSLLVLIFLGVIFINRGYSQTLSYSYKDPCTGLTKRIEVPKDGITVTYYGKINTFEQQDFYNGEFENWSQSVFQTFGQSNPCASVVGIPTAINITQTTALNFVNQINSITALSDMASSIGGMTDVLSGTTNSTEVSSESNDSKKSDDKSNKSGNSENSDNKSENNDNTNDNENNSDNSNQSSSNENSNSTESSSVESEGESSVLGGSVNSVSGSSSSSSGSAGEKKSNSNSSSNNRPIIVVSSDLAGFNFRKSDVSFGGKFNGGYSSMRWDGLRSGGISFDYTTSLRGPNITGFYAWMKNKRIDLISATVTVGFDNKKTAYATLAYGEMWSIKKKLKVVYLLTESSGVVHGEHFFGFAAIVGGMYDFNITKRIQIKVLALYVYAPFVSYYNDIMLKSPHVILPIVGTNVGITKRFKFNINSGGAYAINQNALNYTVTIGTRLIL